MVQSLYMIISCTEMQIVWEQILLDCKLIWNIYKDEYFRIKSSSKGEIFNECKIILPILITYLFVNRHMNMKFNNKK